MVTRTTHTGWIPTKMTPVRAALLSIFMLTGIAMWGAGIYAADAAGDRIAVDGYGVTIAKR